jgi:hypothetical protein
MDGGREGEREGVGEGDGKGSVATRGHLASIIYM